MTQTVGIIGGMGPAAGAHLVRRISELTPAARDQDHIHVLLDSNPAVPDRQAAILHGGPSPVPQLAVSARRLAAAGASWLAVACNTAHAWADEVAEAAGLPLVNMIDETVASAVAARSARIGILATDGCLAADLYQSRLQARGVEPVVLGEAVQAQFMAAIGTIKTRSTESVRNDLRYCAMELVEHGAESIIAGCTEVPLVLQPGDVEVSIVSSTDTLARAIIASVRSEA